MSLITITAGLGCEGMAIGRLVAGELKLELYEDQRLQQEARQMGISPEGLESVDEKAPGLFNRLLTRSLSENSLFCPIRYSGSIVEYIDTKAMSQRKYDDNET